MQICDTCKYWRRIRDVPLVLPSGTIWPAPHGECKLIDENCYLPGSYNEQKKTFVINYKKAWLAGTDEDDDLSLITQPDFGCNQWQVVDSISGG